MDMIDADVVIGELMRGLRPVYMSPGRRNSPLQDVMVS